MKIEVGESLVASWLKHIHHCSITETNWKVASGWAGEVDSCLTHAFECLKREFGEGLFKQSSSLSQVLKQSEVDVVGYNFKSGQVFMAEVAFHENGLNYGSTEKTILNILKKLIRAAFLWHIYFREEGQLIPRIAFVTPKSQTVLESSGIFESLERTQTILMQYLGYDLSLEFISNKRFFDEVYNPVVSISNSVSDSHELFLRSYQLVQLVERHRNAPVLEVEDRNASELNAGMENDVESEIERVKRKVPRWFQFPSQINSRILLAFLELEKNCDGVTVSALADKAKVQRFASNFAQMISISERNHAKVFEVVDDKVALWEPVSTFIHELNNRYIDQARS